MSTEEGPAASDSSMAYQVALPPTDSVAAPRLPRFEDFYRDEYRSVLGLTYVLTGSYWVAEETTQDAFVAAFRRWKSISVYDSPGAWIRRVACNQSVSAVRRRIREARALVRLAGRAERDMVLEESDDEFWRAVRSLPARQAQVVALHYLEDLSVSQIGGVLGCSEGTVKTHLSRARQAVSQALQLEDQE